jgi:hypothetical protein
LKHRSHAANCLNVSLKLLLKRGALLAVANWQAVAIQFLAESTFQVLLAVPILGAAILVAVAIGADLGDLLQGGLRDIVANITRALTSEPSRAGRSTSCSPRTSPPVRSKASRSRSRVSIRPRSSTCRAS